MNTTHLEGIYIIQSDLSCMNMGLLVNVFCLVLKQSSYIDNFIIFTLSKNNLKSGCGVPPILLDMGRD